MICATKWLSQCLESHGRCQTAHSSGSTSYTPTRLLQIGQPSSEKIRLLLRPQPEGTKLQYATLSHCWGASSVLRLTTISFQRLEKGIAISELGQTFQDAIFTARSLGIQLLWIDSLCIFQDSREDWQREAPLMSHVYRDAILNIAASFAADSDVSCFPDRNLSLIQPCTTQTAWIDCQNDTYHLYHNNFWQQTFEDMPLMKRAWVVQELLLAPRVLHLSGRQLFWECYDLAACETYPGGIPPNMQQRWMSKEAMWQAFSSAGSHPVAVEKAAKPQSKNALWKLWTGIVEFYTESNLTYTTDKLVALSGIAKLMERALDDKYCAGLWGRNLITQLFWIGPSNGRQLSPQPSPYRAPSWSWASLDGRISLIFYDEESYKKLETLINIIDCEIETATGDTTGIVTGGTLKLSGWLASIQLRPDSENGWCLFFNGTWWKDRPRLYINLDYMLPTSQLHCLPLFVDTHQSPQWSVSCLLLGPTGDVKGQFRRVGILHAFSGALGMEDWTDFRGTKNEAWLEYEALCSNDRYIISIL
jgi:hypothetical protein